MPRHILESFIQKCDDLLHEIRVTRGEGRRFIFLDEINFTKRSVALREWSAKNSNLAIDQRDIYTGYKSVIAAMTEEDGIVLIHIQSSAVDAADFKEYLNKLRIKFKYGPLALFMDQLAVHKTREVR